MIKSKSKQVTNRNKSNMPNHHHNDRYGLRINNPRQIRNRPQHGLFKDSTYRRRFRNLEHRSEYLQQIIHDVLHKDKWRIKLIRICVSKSVNKFEEIFPETLTEQFSYVSSGSYAHVYRCKKQQQQQQEPKLESSYTVIDSTTTTTNTNSTNDEPQGPKESDTMKKQTSTNSIIDEQCTHGSTVIKLIDVYSELVIKNFNGTSGRSSVSNYKDAYNEFKISMYLAYLNVGIHQNDKLYKCATFPEVYGTYVANNCIPKYFDNSSKIKQIDYGRLLMKRDNDENGAGAADTTESKQLRSRPSIRELITIKPEIAIIKMEDCGVPIIDILSRLNPLQILSLAKQLLLGFMIAEKVYEFEHRDLHLGNIMVKRCECSILEYFYNDKLITVPSEELQAKVIDTTFSRLKYKSRIYFRNLSNLFNEKDVEKDMEKGNRLSHQDETYRAMASEISNNWTDHYPRSNIIWLTYIMKKFINSRPLRKVTRESSSVRALLQDYVSLLFKTKSMYQFISQIYQKPELNLHVPIVIGSIDRNNV